MKLAVSNIAWETNRMEEHLALLRDMGCGGVEFSPSMVWKEPVDTPRSQLLQFKKKVSSYGLTIPSLHSLTYSRPDLSFFDSAEIREKLIRYIVTMGEISNLLESPIMIFGSADSRQIGNRDRDECFRIMANSFGQMVHQLQPLGVTLLIEPLARCYTDSINNVDEAHRLIQMVNHPYFALHIDLKSSFAEKEDQQRIWSQYAGLIKHCHVANPGLRPPSADCPDHVAAARAMKRAKYDRTISIEMGRNFGETLCVVRESLMFVSQTYLEAA